MKEALHPRWSLHACWLRGRVFRRQTLGLASRGPFSGLPGSLEVPCPSSHLEVEVASALGAELGLGLSACVWHDHLVM